MKDLYVQVAFPGGNQLYTYRTPRVIEPKTLLVVPAGAGNDLQIVKAYSMLKDISKLNPSIPYKWVVQEVDLTEYNALVFATKMDQADAKSRL
tara:strand:- start:10171 stop:10449 length:279 start_codon:yes stop_codon:yes gene_type:complete